ncbi:hypothetical protein [Duganella vulcania]|uniref:Uncharacterized protein n=1 Tax=Duganella vulcania TaxID=2692166 RepID=A0A845GCQ3_9BURK|nr:hypothetical protein [Duganella vulcania]MYM92393.1 hypothetical protein [Duganella vulcania]
MQPTKSSDTPTARSEKAKDPVVSLLLRAASFSLLGVFLVGGPGNAPLAVTAVPGVVFLVSAFAAIIRIDRLEDAHARKAGTWEGPEKSSKWARVRIAVALLIFVGSLMRLFAVMVGGPSLSAEAALAFQIAMPLSFLWLLLELFFASRKWS